MRRRSFLGLSGALLAVPLSGNAQEGRKLARIGFIGNSTLELEADLVGPFLDGLHDLGYFEGRNIAIDYRWAEGSYDRLPSLIAELVAKKVDVIVTAGTPAALAVKRATSTIPLVMVAVGDPIGTGLVKSLARPGGNATGLTSMTPELEGKRLELIKEAFVGVARLAVLWNPNNAYQVRDEREVQAAAQALHLPTISLPARTVAELDAALAKIRQEKADAVLVLADRLFLHNRSRIVDFVAAHRLPMMSAYRELAEAGGVMSFGPSYALMHRQAARFVDKILKGANPADLPIEQPAKFELILNLKSAKALGMEIPHAILLRADEVIE